MKKRILTIAVAILMCQSLCVYGSPRSNNSATNQAPTTISEDSIIVSTAKETKEDENLVESELAEPLKSEEVYNLKTLSISIVSSNGEEKLDSITLRSFRIKVNDGVISTEDNRARECVKPKIITEFGKVAKVEYTSDLLVDVNDLSVIFSIEFDGITKITDRVVELSKIDENMTAIGMVELDAGKGLMLEICADLEES